MYGWSQGGVNNVLIFGLNPRDRLTYWHIALVATTFGVVWCSGLLTYLIISSRYLTQTNFPVYILPIILNLALFLFFIIRLGSKKYFANCKDAKYPEMIANITIAEFDPR